MKLLLASLLIGGLLASSAAQVRRHPPGLRAEMVVTGKVRGATATSFILATANAGTYTIQILPSTIIRAPKVRGKNMIRPGMSVTAQGFVHQRIIDATRITVLGAIVTRTK
jgi:hypothetical protein